MTGFPALRLRRLRRTPASRALVRETRLSADRFMAPLFIRKGRGLREPIASLPGVSRVSPDEAAAAAQEFRSLGIPAVILFGLPERKDEIGSGAWDDESAESREGGVGAAGTGTSVAVLVREEAVAPPTDFCVPTPAT